MPNERWHIDRGIPLALLITIVSAAGSGVWFAAKTDGRLSELERRDAERAPQFERLIRVEGKVDALHDRLSEIKALLGRQRTGSN